MDPLSDVLSLLKPRSYSSGGFDAGGDWSILYPQHEGMKCFAVVSGECWLAIDGVPDAVHIQAGDCFLLPSGRSFRAASDLNLPATDASELYSGERSSSVVSWNGGGDFFLIGGHFTVARSHLSILLEVLPPIVHLQEDADKAALRWCLERMAQELRDPQPGGYLIAQDLAHMMLVQALRLHLAQGSSDSVGWLFALADKQISSAIDCMHDQPAHHWTIQKLAERAGMSRSAFAAKFKEKVGASPMEYLTRWRMLLAGARLRDSSDPVSVISRSLGYISEAAFSTAFKRVMGCSPRQYGRRPPVAIPSEEQTREVQANRLELVHKVNPTLLSPEAI